MKLRYILVTMMILLIPLLAFGLDIDEDSNDAVDIAYGGTNAITAAAALTNFGQNTGTDITADLEEEAHGDEHIEATGADAVASWAWGGALTVGDATPPVASGYVYDCTGATAVTILDFYDSGDDDKSEFTAGKTRFRVLMNSASVKMAFNATTNPTTNLSGNASTDFSGSASEFTMLEFLYVGTYWQCINLNMGFSDPTTFASKLVIHQAQDADGDTMTTAEAYNFVWFATGAGTIALPAVVDGMNFCVENHTDGDVLIDPNGTDAIKLNGGTQLTDGWMIIGTDIGDGCCFKYFEAGAWSAWCNGYESNGS